MNYNETIDYLYAQLPMFSKLGKVALKNNLSNTIALCAALDNPQKKFKSIHIAGTNGKGSTSHMLAAVLQSSGYKVGLYTSPHLKDFRERIKVNGTMCTQEFVVDFTEKAKVLITHIQPSFFEVTVAMAFYYFAYMNVDVAIIETGLGGRFDSTNIISPELSVITNIGYDHMNILGNTLAKIAMSKAGIIKERVPVVIGEKNEVTMPVFEEEAKRYRAPIIYAEDVFKVKTFEQHLSEIIVNVENKEHAATTYYLDLNGIYQIKNLITVLAAINTLKEKGFLISEEAIKFGLSHTKKITGLHGRWEILQLHPTVIADVGHNEDGIKQIVNSLQYANFENLHIVIGFVKDKDVKAALSLLPATAQYYFTKAPLERAMPQKTLQSIASETGLKGESYDNVKSALQAAKSVAKKNDMILICGSVFVVAEVL